MGELVNGGRGERLAEPDSMNGFMVSRFHCWFVVCFCFNNESMKPCNSEAINGII